VTASQERLCSMEFITQSVSQSVSQFLSSSNLFIHSVLFRHSCTVEPSAHVGT